MSLQTLKACYIFKLLISGYTLSYIQNNILDDAYGFSSLRDAIKNHKISGVTNADIDELFALYW